MEKDMEKEKNIVIMVNYYLMVNFIMEKDGTEKVKNMMIMENYCYLMVNI